MTTPVTPAPLTGSVASLLPPVAVNPPPTSIPAPAARHEADDALMAYMTELGLGKDLGLAEAAPAPTPVATNAELAAAPGQPAAAPAVVAPPANETPEQKIARLEAELAAAKNPTPNNLPPGGAAPGDLPKPPAAPGVQPAAASPVAPVLTPTAQNPLVNLQTPDQLAAAQRAASELKAWSIQNPDGGELPAHLAQLAENAEAFRTGRAPNTVGAQALAVDADTARNIRAKSEQMLDLYLPARQKFVEVQGRAANYLRNQEPAMLDTAKPEGQLFQEFAASYPQLLTIDHWPLLIADLVRGNLAARAAAKAPAAPAAVQAPAPTNIVPIAGTTQTVPLAPAPPIGGAAPAAPPISQQRLQAAEERARAGTATDQDWEDLGAAAI